MSIIWVPTVMDWLAGFLSELHLLLSATGECTKDSVRRLALTVIWSHYGCRVTSHVYRIDIHHNLDFRSAKIGISFQIIYFPPPGGKRGQKLTISFLKVDMGKKSTAPSHRFNHFQRYHLL